MNPAHAALVAGALREKRFGALEVRANSAAAWREVRGEEGRASALTGLGVGGGGFASQFADDADLLTLMVQDFPGGRTAWPDKGWKVRFDDGRVRSIAGPAQIADSAGLLLLAPLGPEVAG